METRYECMFMTALHCINECLCHVESELPVKLNRKTGDTVSIDYDHIDLSPLPSSWRILDT